MVLCVQLVCLLIMDAVKVVLIYTLMQTPVCIYKHNCFSMEGCSNSERDSSDERDIRPGGRLLSRSFPTRQQFALVGSKTVDGDVGRQ